ncbi:MAG: serine/threonine protein kinase [Ktedonobacteraceae bacterium]|nr:serine/threonine protein kinase [Ktedonobacteraceae bacterium]
MTITCPLFCENCGAALPTQVMSCPGCGNAVPRSSSHSAPTPPGPSASDATQPGPGFLLAGRYMLLEQIGEGGFGVVYKARDRRRPGKLVAVKQINMAALSAQEKIEATDSFYREIRTLPDLRHQSLPRIYDHFTDPEHWYVVMDYIKGRTLEDILKQVPGGRLSLAQVADIGLALCDVLTCLHTQQPPIIFRDVKPANIMLTPWNHLYLIDFGIARRYQEGQRKDTIPLGSPGYAAPEQYGRAQSSPQSDIYGLGATLQTLLTGQEPQEIRLSGLPADCVLPQDVQALIERMMDYDASKRPQIKEIERTLKPYCTPILLGGTGMVLSRVLSGDSIWHFSLSRVASDMVFSSISSGCLSFYAAW